MISPEQCWLKDVCVKGRANQCPTPFCIKLFKVANLYDQALISQRQRQHVSLRIDADGTDREAFNVLRSVEQDIETFVDSGQNLYIHSTTTGNGKTSWALRLAEAYIDKIWYKSNLQCRVLFIHVPRFLISLKESISKPSDYVEHIKSNFLTADLVIFDEIASKINTEYEMEQLLNIINSRLDEGKTNIYTSNLTDAELDGKIGQRLASRITKMSLNITLNGKDKRGLK